MPCPCNDDILFIGNIINQPDITCIYNDKTPVFVTGNFFGCRFQVFSVRNFKNISGYSEKRDWSPIGMGHSNYYQNFFGNLNLSKLIFQVRPKLNF